MKTYTANEAKTRFGEFIDEAQREPVRVMRHDRVVGVMVSAQDYEAMRAFYSVLDGYSLADAMRSPARVATLLGLAPRATAEKPAKASA